MSLKQLAVLFSFTISWAQCGTLSPAAADSHPNIVFIMVDDMGWADLGCYGQQAYATPNLDQMAKEGIRFTESYSGCTVCAPARCTLMTGLHMGHAPLRGNTGGIPLPDSAVTIPEVLREAGYVSGGFGKWGLGDIGGTGVPEKQGFDLFYGYYHQIHAHNYYPKYLVRNSEKETLQKDYSHYLIFEETQQFIAENRERPFFCYAAWTPPHSGYQIPKTDPAWQAVEDKPWHRNTKVHAAFNMMIDRHVGELFDQLKELGIDENTIVFFCSDHGASNRFEGALNSCGPLSGQKRSMHEGGLRVPMIVRWPGHIPADRVSDLPNYFPDMMPTLAELAGASSHVPESIDGISLVPTLLDDGREQAKHDYLYWEWPSYSWEKRGYANLWQAVRHGDWKLLRHDKQKPWELYDLSDDIGEQNDLAAEHPEVVSELTEWIEANRVDMPPQIEPEYPKGKRFY